MAGRWWIMALVGLALVSGALAWLLVGDDASPAQGESVRVETLANGLELRGQTDDASELRAEICWRQEADPSVGECPFTLVRSPADNPERVALNEFECPKCPAVDLDQLWAFLEEAVRDASRTKLYRWELTWSMGSEAQPTARIVNPLVASESAPSGDPSLSNPLLPDAGP